MGKREEGIYIEEADRRSSSGTQAADSRLNQKRKPKLAQTYRFRSLASASARLASGCCGRFFAVSSDGAASSPGCSKGRESENNGGRGPEHGGAATPRRGTLAGHLARLPTQQRAGRTDARERLERRFGQVTGGHRRSGAIGGGERLQEECGLRRQRGGRAAEQRAHARRGQRLAAEVRVCAAAEAFQLCEG